MWHQKIELVYVVLVASLTQMLVLVYLFGKYPVKLNLDVVAISFIRLYCLVAIMKKLIQQML